MTRVVLSAFLLLGIALPAFAQAPGNREEKVRGDKAQIEAGGEWKYDDLAAGIAEAKKTGQPLLVVFRCIPCEACAGLDEKIVQRDQAIRDLMEKFVCVRIVKGNALDLARFQYDYDLSFAAHFMNADGTIYGRYGSFPVRDDSVDVAVEGFRQSLAAAIDIHAHYPANKAQLAGKQPTVKPAHPVPEEYPLLKGKYTSELDYKGKVVQSCVHCHQIRDAQTSELRATSKTLTNDQLFEWPMPDVLGLRLSPKSCATVASVEPLTPAEKGGFRAGDEIVRLKGQAILSAADVQWVLHEERGESAVLKADILRDGKPLTLSLELPPNWRQGMSLAKRPTTWNLRRMATGGILLEPATEEQRQAAGLDADAPALFAKHVGQYNEHATAFNAGVRKGDLIVEFDGRPVPNSETELIAYSLQQKKPGDMVTLTALRGRERKTFKMTLR